MRVERSSVSREILLLALNVLHKLVDRGGPCAWSHENEMIAGKRRTHRGFSTVRVIVGKIGFDGSDKAQELIPCVTGHSLLVHVSNVCAPLFQTIILASQNDFPGLHGNIHS